MNEKTEAQREPLDEEARARREFLKNVGRASVTAPAVALLLAANVRSASATPNQYGGGGSGSGCGGGTILP